MPFGKPANKILVAGQPIIEECVAENTGGSDDVKPGMVAIKGTGDHQVKYAGAAAVNAVGVVDYNFRYKITDAYPEGDPARILKGDFVWVGTLANGQSVSKGDKLICAANGELQAYPGTPAAGDEEKIVAVAEETVDASGGAKSIMARWVQ